MTTHAEARRVLVAELERARVDVSSIPSSVISTVARRVAVGDCTIAQAVEFFQSLLAMPIGGPERRRDADRRGPARGATTRRRDRQLMGPGGKMRGTVDAGIARTLGGAVSDRDERTVCAYAQTSLRLAYPGSNPRVTPAGDAPGDVPGLRGVLDVRLDWYESGEPPLAVRVVVHDEIARGAWRDASIAIGDAVRAALRDRCPAHPHPHTERK